LRNLYARGQTDGAMKHASGTARMSGGGSFRASGTPKVARATIKIGAGAVGIWLLARVVESGVRELIGYLFDR
jgi:hypothetical protein